MSSTSLAYFWLSFYHRQARGQETVETEKSVRKFITFLNITLELDKA